MLYDDECNRDCGNKICESYGASAETCSTCPGDCGTCSGGGGPAPEPMTCTQFCDDTCSGYGGSCEATHPATLASAMQPECGVITSFYFEQGSSGCEGTSNYCVCNKYCQGDADCQDVSYCSSPVELTYIDGYCKPGKQCGSTVSTTTCNDDNFCTTDSCGSGVCVYASNSLSIECTSMNAFGTCYGLRRCSGGALLACDAKTPSAESLACADGVDNDCDATTDCYDSDCSAYYSLGACDGADADFCKEGTRTCTSTGTTSCSDSTGSTTETCNGADDDCDGTVDEPSDLTPPTRACSVGTGACYATGLEYRTCLGAAGWSSTYSGCTAVAKSAIPEVCNDNLDNDCDGSVDCYDSDCSAVYHVDETCDSPLDEDLCEDGIRICSGNTATTCTDTSASIPETTTQECNDGIDNDCDGKIDYQESGTCCSSPLHTQTPYFEIQNSAGNPILRADQKGRLWIKGQVKTWKNPTSGKEFIILDKNANPVFWIDHNTGDMYLRGTINTHSLQEPSASGNFVVRNTTGGDNALWFVTSTGDIYLESCLGTGKHFD